MQDPKLRTALFLRSHPGWTPDDLERADPDVVDLMQRIQVAEARASNRKG